VLLIGEFVCAIVGGPSIWGLICFVVWWLVGVCEVFECCFWVLDFFFLFGYFFFEGFFEVVLYVFVCGLFEFCLWFCCD